MSHNIVTFGANEPDRVSDYDAVGSRGYIVIGQGESNNYSNSAASNFNAGSVLYFYDTSPHNNISGATLTGSSDWYSSVTLPAGKYIIESYFGVDFTASGSMSYAIRLSSNRTAYGIIGDLVDSEDGGPIACTYIDISIASTIDLRVVSGSNIDTVANQGTTVSSQSWLLIRKIG